MDQRNAIFTPLEGKNWMLIILCIFPKYTRRSFQINKLIMRFVCEYHFRLDYEENYETSKTYAKYRILLIITFFIWGALAMFCRQRVHAIISRICPGGNLAVIGGRKKRNILTLGTRIPDKYYFFHFFVINHEICPRWWDIDVILIHHLCCSW